MQKLHDEQNIKMLSKCRAVGDNIGCLLSGLIFKYLPEIYYLNESTEEISELVLPAAPTPKHSRLYHLSTPWDHFIQHNHEWIIASPPGILKLDICSPSSSLSRAEN